ncbi:MAG: hypothetical protein IT208_15205 [Chthonomonadales bacterium]|nr:hypothetical protein [Chthonomonadales bacterium]
MKGLLFLLVLALLALSVWNQMEIRWLRQDIRTLSGKVERQQASEGPVEQAMAAVVAARAAAVGLDAGRARTTLEAAHRRLTEAAGSAGQRAQPALRWLEAEMADLSRRAGEGSRPHP